VTACGTVKDKQMRTVVEIFLDISKYNERAAVRGGGDQSILNGLGGGLRYERIGQD
jgi:hypothetical protein